MLHSTETGKERHPRYSPLSSETSSMSDVTDMRCAVRRGDFAAGTSPLFFDGWTPSSLSKLEPVEFRVLESCAVDVEDSLLLSRERDRDCDRSDRESGRGVFSDASSKLSCRVDVY